MTKKPPFRKLRGYAFDPSMSLQLDTARINEVTYRITWEDGLNVGPEGEYVKVVDRDPASDAVYLPVDLNEKNLLAMDGLDPSESNPQFHQQMVYAVAMNTIKNFEKAIGRKVQWSPVSEDVTSLFVKSARERKNMKPLIQRRYVDKLILYPHAFRGANAYYSSDRKAILFGYFNATPSNAAAHMPGSIVYSCLSHDIIAHEITHAILDGMFYRFMELTNPDVGAFHEALSDIVALFQHFTFTDVMNHEIAKIKGRFNAETLLGKLAVEFGKASGSNISLRDGIGTSVKGVWSRIEPDINSYRTIFECHDRGGILVASVFDAFINIYNQRAEDVIKVATGGSGVLPAGELNAPLTKLLASEASKTASHVLSMCIRALDYCPPVDITFGDYLRAIISADTELVADDKHNYRVAFIDAFRKRGIYPDNINNLSVESLNYSPREESTEFDDFTESLSSFLIDFKNEIGFIKDRKRIFGVTRQFITSRRIKDDDWGGGISARGLHHYFYNEISNDPDRCMLFEKLTGIVFSKKNFRKLGIRETPRYKGRPSIEIQDIRLNNRVSPDGNIQNQVIIFLAQSCGVTVSFDEKDSEYSVEPYLGDLDSPDLPEGTFLFRGGCTLIFDLNEFKLKHVISKPIIDVEQLRKKNPRYSINKARAIMQYRCEFGDYSEMTGFASLKNKIEKLAHVHHSENAMI